jgi:hypothetical protein
MNRYIQETNQVSDINNDNTDRITLEPLLLKDNSRFGSVALETENCIQFWNTDSIYRWICLNPINPYTRKHLSQDEINYIEHYYNGYKLEEQGLLNQNEVELYNLFIKTNGNVNDQQYSLMRYILNPYSFSKQFKEYLRSDETDELVERQQSIIDLYDKPDGTWLIRYSSYNYVYNYHYIKRLGIKFFVFSVVKNGIVSHYLILHRPGRGWTQLRSDTINITETKIIYNYDTIYYVCFLDLIKSFITIHKLNTNMYIN